MGVWGNVKCPPLPPWPGTPPHRHTNCPSGMGAGMRSVTASSLFMWCQSSVVSAPLLGFSGDEPNELPPAQRENRPQSSGLTILGLINTRSLQRIERKVGVVHLLANDRRHLLILLANDPVCQSVQFSAV